jgi:hypothetical protein
MVTRINCSLARLSFVATLLLFCSAVCAPAFAQQITTAGAAPKPADIDRIIRAFTAKETQFRRALNEYGFQRDAVVQTIGLGGEITGEYHRVSFFTFDDKGARFEKINFFPLSTLTEVSITEADLEDLGGVNPFALEADKIDRYNFTYVGKERIDELDLFVFDVSPKVMPNIKNLKDRMFQGRIWVDDKDLQIVRAKGKGVPEDKNNKYPVFDTYREQIDGKYWFPTYTHADDQLVFGGGQVVHLRMLVKYTDFKRGHAEVKITEAADGSTPDESTLPKPTPSPTPQKPKP